jgi:HlyD family secretion protein
MAQLQPSTGGSPPPVATVARGHFIVGVARGGNLESGDIITMKAPREAGTILSYIVPDGESVKKGQLIAKVDTTQYQFTVDTQRLQYQTRAAQVDDTRRSRENDVDQANLQVTQAQSARTLIQKQNQTENEQGAAQFGFDGWNVTYTKTDFEKYFGLEQSGVVAAPDVQQKDYLYQGDKLKLTETEKDNSYLDSKHNISLAQSQADISVANFLVDQSKHQVVASVDRAKHRSENFKRRLDEMEKNLKEGELRADRDGVVVLGTTWDEAGRRPWREGDQVWGSATICEVAALDVLQVPVHVDESSANRLRLGQETIVTFQGLPGRQFAGKVYGISTVARTIQITEDPDAIPNQRVFDVTVRLVKPDMAVLRPGMKANVQFVFRRLANCVSVPIEAVFDRPSQGKFVYVQEGGRFVERPVKTGERNDEAIVILEGVAPGESVALTDPTKAQAG